MTGEPTIINDCQNDDRCSNKANSKTSFITNPQRDTQSSRY